MILDFMKNEADNLGPEGLKMIKLCVPDTEMALNPNLLAQHYENL